MRAVGTQFDVYKKNGGTIVTVVEGRVAILINRDRETVAASVDPDPSPSALSSLSDDEDQRTSILLSAGFHISGVFSSTDPQSLIRFLRERPGVHVIETASEIRVVRNIS